MIKAKPIDLGPTGIQLAETVQHLLPVTLPGPEGGQP